MKNNNDDFLFWLLLFVMLFAIWGCTTLPKLENYTCKIVGSGGVYASATVENAPSYEVAEAESEKLRLKLVKLDMIPAETGSICVRIKDERERKIPGEHPGD